MAALVPRYHDLIALGTRLRASQNAHSQTHKWPSKRLDRELRAQQDDLHALYHERDALVRELAPARG
jgi:hypothetical protein